MALLPQDVGGLPDVGVEIPRPTIDHTLIDCPQGCGRLAWIGPVQLRILMSGQGDGFCYYCLIEAGMTDPDIAASMLRPIPLNPDIDKRPRRT